MLNWEASTDTFGNDHLRSLVLSEEAHTEWLNFALAIESNMRPGEIFEHVTDWAGKAPGAAARLAGVLHCIKHAHGQPWEATVTQETMTEALEIMAVVSYHSLAAMDIMGADPTIASARHVWDWIKRNRMPQFSVRDAFNSLRGSFPHVHQLREALDVLEERGYLRIYEVPHDGPGRKPSPIVRTRPELSKDW
jgi:hypothetical protein